MFFFLTRDFWTAVLFFFKVLRKCLWSNTAVKTQAHWVSINVPINTDKDYLSILHFLNSLLQKEVIQNLTLKLPILWQCQDERNMGSQVKLTLSFSPRFYQATWKSGPRWLRAHVLAIQKGEDLNLIHIRYLALKSIDCNLNPCNAYLLGIYLQLHTLPQPIKKAMGSWTCENF